MTAPTGRLVTANLALTLDGRYHGPGGPGDLSPIGPYVASDTARDQMVRMCAGATTAVLGRGNAEGFLGYWGPVAEDDSADPRDQAYARWLVGTEKVVLSTTLTEAPWDRACVVNAPAADVVADLRGSGEGDILVNSSPGVIRDLLAADLVDRLYLVVVPEIAGSGGRLFEDGLPSTRWTVAYQEAGPTGELALVYDRVR
jgi:dihydrofolate reductase